MLNILKLFFLHKMLLRILYLHYICANVLSSAVIALLVIAGTQAASHAVIGIGAVGLVTLRLPVEPKGQTGSSIATVVDIARSAAQGHAAFALVMSIAAYVFGFMLMVSFSGG